MTKLYKSTILLVVLITGILFTETKPVSAQGAWTAMANTPDSVNHGGALAYTGGDYVYSLRGGGTTDFWRYSISGNSWTAMANSLDTVAHGVALAYDVGDHIYAQTGWWTTDFWRYSISRNSWTAMENLLCAVGSEEFWFMLEDMFTL